MKWLGQYIQDLTARFRDDVYLENISSGTIASGGNLGLDSNNKIVKQSDTGITDLHGAGVDGSANQLLTDDGDGTVTSEANLTWDGDDLNITSVTVNKPVVEIKATSDEQTGSFLSFVKDKGAAGADEDVIATINFTGDNAAQEQTSFGQIKSTITTAADTDEAGEILIKVATSDGSTSTLQNGLSLNGESGSGATPGKVDATIGFGATSITTLAGALSVGSSVSAINRSGEIQVASQPNVTTLAGLTSAGATGVNLEVNYDDIQFYNAVNNGNPQLSIGSGAAERLVIWPQYDSGAQTLDFVKFATYAASGTANKGYFNFNVDEVSVLNIKDSGLSLNTGFGIDINGDDIITDSGGTATLSNIDALDSTTRTTIATTIDAATTSSTGSVELATTGEADTGTDTARAVTPAGLKSHVDARYSYQYLHFSFKANNVAPDLWRSPSQVGVEYYLWDNNHGSGVTQAASDAPKDVDINTTISVDYLDQTTGFIIPKACKLDGFYGNCRVNGTNPNTLRPVLGLFRAAEPADGNTSDLTATCVAFDSYDTASGNRKNRFLKLETQGLDTNLAQGDILFPATGFDATASDSAGDIWGAFTIVLKTLIP